MSCFWKKWGSPEVTVWRSIIPGRREVNKERTPPGVRAIRSSELQAASAEKGAPQDGSADRGTLGYEEPVGTEDGNKGESWRWDGGPLTPGALLEGGYVGFQAAEGEAGASRRVGRAQRCCWLYGDVLWLWEDSGSLVLSFGVLWGVSRKPPSECPSRRPSPPATTQDACQPWLSWFTPEGTAASR